MSNATYRPNDDGSFSGGGPITLSTPGAALPMNPIGSESYAHRTNARIGLGHGTLFVIDVTLDRPLTVSQDATVVEVATLLRKHEAGFVSVIDSERRFLGVVPAEALLSCLADNRVPSKVSSLISSQIPTCGPQSLLLDAVRQMLACFLRRIPVVGETGILLGTLSLSAAASAAERDPTIVEAIEAALRPSLFARAWA